MAVGVDCATLGRRRFLRAGLAAAGSASLLSAANSKRRFFSAFVPGSLGVTAGQALAIEMAARHDFDAVQPFGGALVRDGVQRHVEALETHGLRWAAAGLSVEYRKGAGEFKQGLAGLPREARALQEAGVTRMGTWILPSSATLTYLQNFKQTATRLRQVAAVLADHGLRFGLEYVGTKRNWTAEQHSFVHTMAETNELIAEIGASNVGLVLDSWHWWTAAESAADIRTLSNQDVLSCDLNDAPVGLAREDQYDSRRELPLATGVIEIRDFLEALVSIGYDGPVRAEPFSQKLSDMEDEQASNLASKALRDAFALVD